MRCARSAISKGLLAALAAALAGCGVVREPDGRAACPSYETGIRPIVDFACSECHGTRDPKGGYVVGAYVDLLSRRPDGTGRIDPGNGESLFLQAARGTLEGHAGLGAEDVAKLERWVVECRAASGEYQYHPQGWSTPTDTSVQDGGLATFHGKALRQKFYRVYECQKCHGEDLRGGGSGVDCASCHTFAPTGELGCSTCHGRGDSAAPPRDLNGVSLTSAVGVGAHQAHVQASATHRAIACTECHRSVTKLEDEGHFRTAGKFEADGAEVILRSGPGGMAQWDRATATCTNSACHDPSARDVATSKKDPVWTTEGQIGCGSCHGAPPSTHHPSATQCEVCHGAGYASNAVDLTTHLNGQVDFRGSIDRCDSCHSGPASPTFVDLHGRTADAGVQSVGAHDAHLQASRMRGPMTCNECHLVPTTLFAPGHLDTGLPAEVFPTGFTGLATTNGTMAVYTAANATCSNYCHNGGRPQDTTPGLIQTPSWTGGPDTAACGKCHGLPPLDGTAAHQAAVNTTCDTCHGGSVSADGGIIFSALPDGGVTSKHLDGRITGQQ